jgi:hypothetical protein
MEIIVSHDVDHLTLWEHAKKDLIIPKFFIRSYIEFINQKISIKELVLRHSDLITNKWNGIQEIIEFNKENGIVSTFFFGMDNALGLSYNHKDSKELISYVIENGFHAGVHGISYNDVDKMKKEIIRFKELSGLKNFGIRMHYLRHDLSTFKIMEELGYTYDSTVTDIVNPYNIGRLVEFPIHLMDGWVMFGNRKFQSVSFKDACEQTKIIIQKAFDNDTKYFSYLFHDCYYRDSYKTWKDWYEWTINYLLGQGFKFTTYNDALLQLQLSDR